MRLSNLASQFDYSNGLDMKFLDEVNSWNLFSKTVFGEEIFPPELEDTGKKILKGCKGLPLSIVVIGGLLSKSESTQENWEVTEKNLSSIVNSEDEESCLQILYTSYNNLPVYIKPCFLFMGVFAEDEAIPIFLLIQQLVAEGFIKPYEGKSMEEAAEDCIEELIDRNLLLVGERNHYGKMKSCKMHDLLRDLSLREGEKDKFSCALLKSSNDKEISQSIISTQRRIAATLKLDEEYLSNTLLECLEPGASSLVRTLIGKFSETLLISSFRLLRVCMVSSPYVLGEENGDKYYEIFIRLVNLRLLAVDLVEHHSLSRIPCSASFHRNLQTVISFEVDKDYVMQIWKMPQLRKMPPSIEPSIECRHHRRAKFSSA